MIVFIAARGSHTGMLQTEISIKDALPEARIERLTEKNPGKKINEILKGYQQPFFLTMYAGDTITPALKDRLLLWMDQAKPETGAVVIHPAGASRIESKIDLDHPHAILWRTAAMMPANQNAFSEISRLPFDAYLFIDALFRLRAAWKWEYAETDVFVPSKTPLPEWNHNRKAYADILALIRQPISPGISGQRDSLSTPVISVVISTYNDAAYLPWAVHSVMAQSYDEWELIVVDDGSTDETPEYLNSLQGHKQIRFLTHEQNLGKAESLNHALSSAKGSWLLELDADDWLAPDGLLRLAETAAILQHEAVVYAGHHEWTQRMQGQLIYRGVKPPPSTLSASKLLAEGLLIAPRMYRTISLKKHHGWNTSVPWGGRLFEDVELLARLSLKETFHYIALPLYHRRIRSSSVSHVYAGNYDQWRSWMTDRGLSNQTGFMR